MTSIFFVTSVQQWFQFLFFCEDSAPVGQVGVREFPITSHFSPITLVAACRAVTSCSKSVFATFGGTCSLNVRPPLFQFGIAFPRNDLSLLWYFCSLLFKIRLSYLGWN